MRRRLLDRCRLLLSGIGKTFRKLSECGAKESRILTFEAKFSGLVVIRRSVSLLLVTTPQDSNRNVSTKRDRRLSAPILCVTAFIFIAYVGFTPFPGSEADT